MPFADRFECGYRTRGANAILVEAWSAPSFRPVERALGERIVDLNLHGNTMSVTALVDGGEVVCTGVMPPGVMAALTGLAQDGARALAELNQRIREFACEHWAQAILRDPVVRERVFSQSPGPNKIPLRIIRVRFGDLADGCSPAMVEGKGLFEAVSRFLGRDGGIGVLAINIPGRPSIPVGAPPMVHFADYLNQMIRERVWEALVDALRNREG